MSRTIVAAVVFLLSSLPSAARAHCDTLDGPVVQTARRALETGKVNPVLAWVRPQNEAAARGAHAEPAAAPAHGHEGH